MPQLPKTLSVVLSKPRWLWGCKMGANCEGVVGGNEAIWTSLAGDLRSEPRLLGMDILRLALERGGSARAAAEECARLTEVHGQGGGCAEDDSSWTYENGYIFADCNEAFVVETCGVHGWVMERVPPGSFRNISNGISIRTNIHSIKAGLKEDLCTRGLCTSMDEPFDWKIALSGGRCDAGSLHLHGREKAGHGHLAQIAKDLQHGHVAPGNCRGLTERFLAILRDADSGICFRDLHGFNSTGSQISVLALRELSTDRHFFSCASDPATASYKHFTFPVGATGAEVEDHTSLDLWRAWRRLALAGGRLSSASEATLHQWEQEALASADGSSSTPTLCAACQRELDLISAACITAT